MTHFTLDNELNNPFNNRVDTQLERSDIPFFAEQALTELSSLTALSIPQKLQNFSTDTLSLSTAFQQQLVDYLKQRMLKESDMSARFLLKMLLDTAEAVLLNQPLPLYAL